MVTGKQRKILFIEGSADRSNGALSQGFHKLLKKKLAGNMPRIIMGNGKYQTINKFKSLIKSLTDN